MKTSVRKSAIDWKEYQRLELITPEKITLRQKLQQFWQDLAGELTGNGEPRLWQTLDRAGNAFWNGYDPTTGRSVRGLSEADMLTWLEQRHYSRSEFSQPRLPIARRGYFQPLPRN